MTFGIALRGVNSHFFGDTLGLILDFIPQILFMLAIFVYLVAMIFIKWSISYTYIDANPPSLITLLINIFLKMGEVEGDALFAGQSTFNFYMLIIALISIPILLFPKPIILFMRQGQAKLASHSEYEEMVEHDHKHEEHNEPFSELFMHQIIETIEFVLGTVSNTASYLRLWALSLAHAQLSKVFFEKFLLGAIHDGSIFMIIFGYFCFANATFAVLMCMDLMECCLHTLRLHWVEFQNKFYKGDGYKFQPFSFRNIIEVNA